MKKLAVALGALLVCSVLLNCAAPVQIQRRNAGFHLILAEASTREELPPPTPDQQAVVCDQKHLRASERSEVRYLLLRKNADVPLALAKNPTLRNRGENGFPELWLELTPDAARALERLTRDHLGEKVAFVIDGEPVTTHKIRSPISGGQFRLTRCTDTACRSIYARLGGKQ